MYRVTNIFKIGGSLAIIIPAIVIEKAHLKNKEAVIVQNTGNIIEIYKVPNILDNKDKVDKGGFNVIDR